MLNFKKNSSSPSVQANWRKKKKEEKEQVFEATYNI